MCLGGEEVTEKEEEDLQVNTAGEYFVKKLFSVCENCGHLYDTL